MKQPTKSWLKQQLAASNALADAFQKQCINLVNDKKKLEINYNYYKESASAWYRAYREQFDQCNTLRRKAGDEAIKWGRKMRELDASLEKIRAGSDFYYKKYNTLFDKHVALETKYNRIVFAAVLEGMACVLFLLGLMFK